MDEARAVLARLDRIEALEREGAPPGVLLEELRGLVHEAEVWAKREGDERARKAVEDCDAALVQPVLASTWSNLGIAGFPGPERLSPHWELEVGGANPFDPG